jgi:hypothetical protein
VISAELQAGAGSYIDFVLKIVEAGDYELSVALSAVGPCTLSTAAVVDAAKQAGVGYPMKELADIEKSRPGAFDLVSAGTVRFDQAGLHLLRFSSRVDKQRLQIDQINIKKHN